MGISPMPEASPLPPHRLERAAEFIIGVIWALASLAMLIGICVLLATGNRPSGRDVISFWAAGHRIATHTNPYDEAATLELERSAGFPTDKDALIMRNPPYALPLVLLLAPFQLHAASLLWSLLLIGSLGLSVHLLWCLFGRPANWIQLIGYTFGPAMVCILGGQSALFALLGLVLFLRLHRDHGFAAGAALWLCALKPHLFLPFGVVLLLWALAARRYRVLAGAASALLAGSAIATWLDPSVWAEYSRMMHSPNLSAEFIPSIGYLLRSNLPPHAAWLQYLPTAIACCWAIYYFAPRRSSWDWIHNGALLMLVSVMTSPYAWVSDHSVLIPALLAGAWRAGSRAPVAVLALLSASIDIAQLAGKNMHSVLYTLVACLWLAWYLYATASRNRHNNLNAIPVSGPVT